MIKFLIMDVDGTMTDGTIFISETGETFKAFNVKDGYGIAVILKSKGIIPVVMTGRSSKILENRCKEIGIEEIHQGVKDKFEYMKNFIAHKKIKPEEVAYIGDDLNDFECMEYLCMSKGTTGCPEDAVPAIQEVSTFISTKEGGKGAVREFIEFLTK